MPLLKVLINLSLWKGALWSVSVPLVSATTSAMEILRSGVKYRLSITKQKYEGDYPLSLKLIVIGVVFNCCYVYLKVFFFLNGQQNNLGSEKNMTPFNK